MNPETLTEMMRQDDAEWAALNRLLDEHQGGPVHDVESPEWEARHVYAHFARWLNNSMDDFEAVLNGSPRPTPPEGDDDAINARWKAEDDALALSAARDLAQRAYTRRVRLIQSIREGQWTPTLDAIARADGYQHIGGHRRYIERARGHGTA